MGGLAHATLIFFTMKTVTPILVFLLLGGILAVLAADSAPPAPKLKSAAFDWSKLEPKPTANGVRRDVFDGGTTTLDKIHCHITTLNPGQASAEQPRLHLQEEVIVVKEGSIEATADGRTQTVGPGSVIFFASHATTRLRNAGDGPATYVVIYYYTSLTPKS